MKRYFFELIQIQDISRYSTSYNSWSHTQCRYNWGLHCIFFYICHILRQLWNSIPNPHLPYNCPNYSYGVNNHIPLKLTCHLKETDLCHLCSGVMQILKGISKMQNCANMILPAGLYRIEPNESALIVAVDLHARNLPPAPSSS